MEKNTPKSGGKASSEPGGDAARCPDFAEIIKQSTPDHSLFGQIASCFSERLAEFAKYVCRDETTGQDAAQDAMIAAMESLDTYRGDSSIEVWLRRIVVSACSRLRRGKKNNPNIHLSLDAAGNNPALTDSSPDQELKLLLAERLELVYEEIENLDEPNRSLLKLHDVQERSISDLANQYGLTENSVKSRLKRARARVREKLLERLS